MSAHLSRPRLFQGHLRNLVWVWVWVWDWIHSHTPLRTRSPSSRHPPFTQHPFPLRSLVCGGQPSPHKPRIVVSHITCPPLSSSPHAQSFVLGTAVINTHTQSLTSALPMTGLGQEEGERVRGEVCQESNPKSRPKPKPNSADVAERGVASIGVRSSGNLCADEEYAQGEAGAQ
jgi:hypothetical protein